MPEKPPFTDTEESLDELIQQVARPVSRRMSGPIQPPAPRSATKPIQPPPTRTMAVQPPPTRSIPVQPPPKPSNRVTKSAAVETRESLADLIQQVARPSTNVMNVQPPPPSGRMSTRATRPLTAAVTVRTTRQQPVPRRRWPLVATGSALILAGVGLGIWQGVFAPTEAEAAAAERVIIAPAEQQARTKRAAKFENRAITPIVARSTPEVVNHEKIRQSVLKQLEVGGRLPAFMSMNELKAPASIYLLLREPLDEMTEATWREAGLFEFETEIFSPYLRQVMVKTPEQQQLLQDRRVDQFATTLDPNAPQQ